MAAACKWLIPTGVTHGVVRWMLSSFGKTAGKGNAGLGLGVTRNEGWRQEEAGALVNSPGPKSEPATTHKPHCAMLHWALQSAGSVPWAAPGGKIISPVLQTRKPRHKEAVSCSGATQRANHSHGRSAFKHSFSETCCSVLILQVWHYVKHSQCTSGGLSSSPLTHLQQHQKYAAVAWK